MVRCRIGSADSAVQIRCVCIVLLLLGPIIHAGRVGALLLWKLGTNHFDLEVDQLVKNSLPSRALECGWDLNFLLRALKQTLIYLESSKSCRKVLLVTRKQISPPNTPSWTAIYHFGVGSCVVIRCCMPGHRTAIDPFPWDAVMSMQRAATANFCLQMGISSCPSDMLRETFNMDACSQAQDLQFVVRTVHLIFHELDYFVCFFPTTMKKSQSCQEVLFFIDMVLDSGIWHH